MKRAKLGLECLESRFNPTFIFKEGAVFWNSQYNWYDTTTSATATRVPNASDAVFFNKDSGKEVLISSGGPAICGTLNSTTDWDGKLMINGGKLTVTGYIGTFLTSSGWKSGVIEAGHLKGELNFVNGYVYYSGPKLGGTYELNVNVYKGATLAFPNIDANLQAKIKIGYENNVPSPGGLVFFCNADAYNSTIRISSLGSLVLDKADLKFNSIESHGSVKMDGASANGMLLLIKGGEFVVDGPSSLDSNLYVEDTIFRIGTNLGDYKQFSVSGDLFMKNSWLSIDTSTSDGFLGTDCVVAKSVEIDQNCTLNVYTTGFPVMDVRHAVLSGISAFSGQFSTYRWNGGFVWNKDYHENQLDLFSGTFIVIIVIENPTNPFEQGPVATVSAA